MRLLSTFTIALRALRRNKMRSALTALGIIIGVGAVIAMVGIGNGARAQVEAQIAGLGENLILVFPGSITSSGIRTGWGGSSSLKIEDVQAIQREVPEVVAISPEVRTQQQVSAAGGNWFTQVLGESAQYFEMREWAITDGAAFTDQDIRGANKVVVIGSTLAQQLYGNASPVGQILRINNVPFVVTGVLASKGMSMHGQDQDDVAIIPWSSAQKRVTGGTSFRAINIQVADRAAMQNAQDQITSILRQRHRIAPGKDDDFTVRTQQEIAEAATATTNVMTLLLGAIASVSLVVGGIGIMNIMLVSVTERTREIGIRISVGAHGRDILTQFLIEAVALSCLGGIIGILLGVVSAQILSKVANWPTLISFESIAIAFLFSAGVGIFFGFYPARKAARLDPIEALRYE
ncbi:MAG TPA: ABC transporter permease [Chthoniobacterales bacterium]